MKVCLYDWNHGGHHPSYLRLFAEALQPDVEVVIAASTPSHEELSGLDVERLDLGDPRPPPRSQPKGRLARLDEAKLREAAAAARSCGADAIVVMYFDPFIRRTFRMRELPVPTVALLHSPRFHYGREFGTSLPPMKRIRARGQQALFRSWRGRPRSLSVYTIDPVATELWNGHPGLAPAYFIAEPPVPDPPPPRPASERSGCVIFGHIDHRKGLGRIAEAFADGGGEGLEMQILGRGSDDYERTLARHINRLENGGVTVERNASLTYAEALERIGSARCVILAFGLVPAASRVLLEAATMNTPVVGPRWGLVGHLVSENGLGVTADPSDPAAIKQAILAMTTDPGVVGRFEPAMRAYVEKCGWDRFRAAVRDGVGATV